MVLATIFGLPFVRLRAALPEELFAGSVGQALGRRAGLSVRGLVDAQQANFDVMTQLARGLSCRGARGEQIPTFDAEDEPQREWSVDGSATQSKPPAQAAPLSRTAGLADEAGAPADDGGGPASPDQLVGTALVLAFMSNAKTLPVVELARRQRAASAHFAGVKLEGIAHDFDALLAIFTVMLSPGNLSSRGDWLEKSRLWRLIILQQADGGWCSNDSLAFALEAHSGHRRPPREAPSKCATLLSLLAGGDLDDAIDQALTSSDEEEEAEAQAGEEKQHPAEKRAADCPLTFSKSAVRRRMPRALLALNAAYNRQQAELAQEAARMALARLEWDIAQQKLQVLRGAADEQARRDAAAAALRRERREAAALADQACAPALFSSAAVVDTLQQAGTQLQQQLRHMAGSLQSSAASTRLALWPPSVLPRSEASGTTLASFDARSAKPRRLRPRVPVERIWATVLVMSVLEELDSCWLADEDAEPERTIVDAGRAFLETQAASNRRLRRLLKSGDLQAAAERARKDWSAIQDYNVGQLRDTEVINKFTALTHMQRASARIVRSMMTDHGVRHAFACVACACARAARACARASLLSASRPCINRLSQHSSTRTATLRGGNGARLAACTRSLGCVH
jgi:hypothetical protein